MQHLIIVARDRPDIYEDLKRQFQTNAALRILYDRRQPAASNGDHVPDRRSRRQTDDRLSTHGHILIRVA
ncbi:MAG: hypothetical protein HYU41_00815 [Candidatus Rokubacteria bacterium]|nr:hypothetical protein [Candidatus Rokubacteria bacterium]